MSVVQNLNQWEYPLTSFQSLNNDDFIAMLEKQVGSMNHPTGFTLTPPLSEESSPSPPNSELDNRMSTSTPDDPHKRKISPDDDDDLDDEAPHHKSAHRGGARGDDDDDGKRGHSRRKSLPHQKDESRLMKRKEQNRAAQRAFRERKEKHVKDLEDKVAVLEAEKAEQAHENENLRDLLSRLQNENQVLKTGQFTFSMPAGSNNKKRTPSSSTSESSPGSSDLPEPVFSRTSPPSVEGSFNNSAFNLNSTLSNDTSLNASLTASPDSMNALFSSFPQTPNSWTTLATAPQYTSYRDPAFDRIFGGAGDISPYISRGGEDDEGANLEDLFGEEFQDLIPIVGDFSPAAEAILGPLEGASPPRPYASDAASAAPLPPVSEVSPGVHDEQVHGTTPCPETKTGIARLIAKGGPESTFGPPVETQSASGMAICPLMSNKGANQAPLTLPRASANGNHVAIGDAWKQVKSNPHFEECDIDELCALLKDKARCDSGRPVIEESSVKEIVSSMYNRAGGR